MFEFSKEGSSLYICMSNKEMYTLKTIFEEVGGHWSSFIIWDKVNFVLGHQDYQRQYEPILYGWKEGGSHYFTDQRNKPDIWKFQRNSVNNLHPTQKPVALVIEAIKNSSKGDDIVLDPFLGSGSTLIACEETRRICYGFELDPKFVEVICQRYEQLTGDVRKKVE